MDPLTHTLVGANLAATRLGDKTRLAAPALLIGANLPDVDAILYFTGHSDLALGFRRGWTHGVVALALLPVLQTGLLLLYARLRRGESKQVQPLWLLVLSSLAILTHPALDWLNTYGMRWLMPFDGRWSYGDSVYIMDPWLWMMLGVGWLSARRPTPVLLLLLVVIAAMIGRMVLRRSPEYLIVIAAVVAVLLAAMFWKGSRQRQAVARRATVALTIACSYIGLRLMLNEFTEFQVQRNVPSVRRTMAAPHPLDPARWEFVAETPDSYRYGSYNWLSRRLTLSDERLPLPQESPEWSAAQRHPAIRGFMSWVRFPWYEVERTAAGTRVHIYDARRAASGNPRGRPVVVTLPDNATIDPQPH